MNRWILMVFALTLACSNDEPVPAEAEPEEYEIIESRLGPCYRSCEGVMNPECPIDPTVFSNLKECAEACASTDPRAAGLWLRDEERGVDPCAEEWDAKYSCWASSTCEDRETWKGCHDEHAAHAECRTAARKELDQ